jgi:putative drug exporter of the RND superfamily
MSRVRRISEIPAGSWTRWLVVGFWVVVLAIAFPLSKKLTGAERNDTSAWLPAGAESTKVLDLQARFQSPNIYPVVIVYARPSGHKSGRAPHELGQERTRASAASGSRASVG